MSRYSLFLAPFAVALAASALTARPVLAQSSGYPYWASAPSSYRPPAMNFDHIPGMSPDAVSKAAHSSSAYDPDRSYSGAIGAGVRGGYLPPFLAASDPAFRQPGSNYTAHPTNSAHIWLHVPKDAQVWVDGEKTKQSGQSRHFFSPPLTPGKKYRYDVRVRWTTDGKPVERQQRISVRAGATVDYDFAAPKSH